jgi:hypothetical protein
MVRECWEWRKNVLVAKLHSELQHFMMMMMMRMINASAVFLLLS